MRPALPWLALSLMGPLVALVAIWYVPIAHYWAGPSRVTGETVERARAPLPQGVAPLLAARDFDVPARAREGLAAAKVRRLQATGELQLAGFAPVRVDLPFDPANLDRGTPGWRLQVVSLVVPRLLLDAYRETGDRRYLVLARDAVLAWARYEAGRWLPRGMLWNDHAVAARLFVLADFWQAYRQHPELMTRAQARRVLAFAGRGIALTARPAHYNPRTNHGILQDLALWHAHLAFPGLPTATDAARVARERFGEHRRLVPRGDQHRHVGGRGYARRVVRLQPLPGAPGPPGREQHREPARESGPDREQRGVRHGGGVRPG